MVNAVKYAEALRKPCIEMLAHWCLCVWGLNYYHLSCHFIQNMSYLFVRKIVTFKQ